MAILALSLAGTVNILYVALGLGLVIFFHELGHFMVAKWCDVHVERFSIGFGPILWRYKKGETEYALSAIPFGGYVKMLGQDDVDPSQLSSEEIAADPRSYSSKSVPQRMAIISAGVIMNVITGLLFFAVAFGLGVDASPAIVGTVQVGMPAWQAGIESGDRITRINDREVQLFKDIPRGVALSRDKVITIEGVHQDGTTYKVDIEPDRTGTRRIIGVFSTQSLQLAKFKDKSKKKPTAVGTSAALAEPSFEQGDTILKVGDTKVLRFSQLQDFLSRKRGETFEFLIQRDQASEGETEGETVAISVKPNRFRTLGLWMGTGKIVAVKKGSPADVEGMRPGDRITRINDKIVGKDINPLRLPDYLAGLHGHAIRIMVSRPVEGGESKEEEILIESLLDKPGWVERPIMPGDPLSIPALGVAFHLIPNVLKVDEGSPAAKANIQTGEIQKMEFLLPEGEPFDGFKNRENGDERVFAIEFKDKDNKPVLNWAYAFWTMQSTPTRTVRLTIRNAGETQIVEIEPRVPDDSDWFLPTRGIRMMPLKQTIKAGSIFETLQMGMLHTQNSIADIYLTLRNLVSGDLSYRELHGPLGIAVVAYEFASQGLAKLSLFLGLLSINLAVLNFLPIPVLDGGHMVFLAWEGITRKRPSERVLVAATYFGMAFVLGLMILVLYLDIVVHGMGVN